MKLYKCIISDDEMFADTFKITESEDGFFYEVEGKNVTRNENFDDRLISANASAEEEQESNEGSQVSGCNIVLNHNLVSVPPYKKKDYYAYMNKYAKLVKAKLEKDHPERVTAFMEAATAAVKKIGSQITDYDFYQGESQTENGMLALLNYREDGITPYMLFVKEGLFEEKL
ncbi:translationally-controlled tumor protein homolog [Antennarius striatus]|uniref:translationally-controlled tumor protein homolog n=1 Tax=Antennarius striatus TaxID=241820 RepID=UPI0035B05DEE